MHEPAALPPERVRAVCSSPVLVRALMTVYSNLRPLSGSRYLLPLSATDQVRSQTLTSFDEALRRVVALAQPVGVETVPFADAEGRVLSAPLRARSSMPPWDVSAMDGYAVRDEDLATQPAVLPVAGEVAAGDEPRSELPQGAAFRILTGAPVPHGATRVVIQENVCRRGDHIEIMTPVGPRRNIRARASDFEKGDVLAPAGQIMGWRAMTTAAAADRCEVEVFCRPRLVILATGDELAPPGEAHCRPGAIPESISYGIVAFARAYGCEIIRAERIPDDLGHLARSAEKAVRDADLVIVIGGASVGDRDFSRRILGETPDYVFSGVAIKPGKPVWLARRSDKLILGLPGNPTSALVTARLFLAPLLAGLGGRNADDATAFRTWRLGGELSASGDRESFVLARACTEAAIPLDDQSSAGQRALAGADLLIRLPPHSRAFASGDEVQALCF